MIETTPMGGMGMGYIVTLSRNSGTGTVTIPFNDRPFVGDRVFYEGVQWHVVAVSDEGCGCWNYVRLGHCTHTA
jgi:hypothetical protein